MSEPDRAILQRLQRGKPGWGALAANHPTDLRIAVLAAFEAARAAYASGHAEAPDGSLFRLLAQLAADPAFARQPIVNTVLRFAQDTFSKDAAWDAFVVDDGSERELLEQSLARYAAVALDELVRQPPAPSAPLVSEPTPIQDYAPGGRYAVGDRLRHPRFGTGVVEKVLATKIEIRFEAGLKVLITG